MKVLLAGATGVVGRALMPMLVTAGHDVHALSRTDAGAARMAALGAHGVRGDVLDADGIATVVAAVRPSAIINEVTDLAGMDLAANARARRDGTHNLVEAALAGGVGRFVSQSISWAYGPGPAPARETEPLDVDAVGARRTTVQGVGAAEADARRMPDHVVLRYGMFYGPDTWNAPDGLFAQQLRAGTFTGSAGVASHIHVTDAAAAAVAALAWPPGIVNVVDDDPAPSDQWIKELLVSAGIDDAPTLSPAAEWERGADNTLLHDLGFTLRYPTWRGHLASN